MTLKKHIINKRALRAFLPLAGLGIAAAALSGCGGASQNASALTAPTPDSGPVIYGQNSLAILTGGNTPMGETSGLGYVSGSTVTGIETGATNYVTDSGAGPLPGYSANFAAGIAIGFSTLGNYFNGGPASALLTTDIGSVVFRANISQGALNKALVDINTSSVILTSSEASGFSQPLTFDKPGIGVGPLGQGEYTTGTFALPASFATTGLHTVTASVSDTASQKSHTDFDFVVLAPTDSGVLFPFGGATVPAGEPAKSTAAVNTVAATITNAITGARTRVVLDDTNTFILFAAPGDQTVTVTANVTITHPDKTTVTYTQTGTQKDTLAARALFIGKALTVAGNTPATAPAASARPRLKSAVIKH